MRKFLKRIMGRRHPAEHILRRNKPLNDKLSQSLEVYLKEIGAERGCILLELIGRPPEVIYQGPSQLEERFPFSRSVVDAVLDEGRGFYCYDSHEEFEAADSESLKSQGARSFVCTPIQREGLPCGVIYLDNPTSRGMFSQANLSDLEAFATLISEVLPVGEEPGPQES